MDEFAKEYFKKLEVIASNFKSRRRELAKSRIKMFTAALTRQLVDQKEKFDLVISAGNSGLFMSYIAKLIYENLGIKMPLTIALPIYRFNNDNSYLKKLIEDKLKTLPKNPNILFIDDEIFRGLTVQAVLGLITNEIPESEIRLVIIAENHFFEWHVKMPDVSVNFFSYSPLIQGLTGNISRFIPEKLFVKLKSKIADVESYNHAMAIVIGRALKRKDSQSRPFYDYSVNEFCQKNIKNYESVKSKLLHELVSLVKEGISEYKNKQISFRF